MIPRINKFPLRTDFLSFRTKSKKLSTGNLTVYWLPATRTRLSIVVPKKVNKLATVRNWLKRMVYDNLWSQIKDKDLDVVIVFKPIALTKSNQSKDLLINVINNLKFIN